MLGTLVSRGLSEGMTASSMLGALQEAGIGVRRQDFFSLVRQVQASEAMTDQWSSLAHDAMPNEADAVEWSGGRTDTYLYRVRMYIREGGQAGLGFYEGNFDIVSDALITPEEAMARARDIWDSGETQGSGEGRELWGQSLGGIYHQLGNQ